MVREAMALGALLAGLGGAAFAETPAERGAYLVNGPMGCGNCHTPRGPKAAEMGFAGADEPMIDSPAMTVYAPNITPAGEIGTWNDAELAKALREGMRPDGTLIGPPMPARNYRGLSDSDLGAIVAYLRTLTPVAHDVPRSDYRGGLPPSYGPPVEHVADVERGPTAEYGAYVAKVLSRCVSCHTPMGPNTEHALGQGGNSYDGPWGVSVSSNITSGPEGIGGFSDAEVAGMIAHGVKPDGSKMQPPMPYANYAKMSEGDLAAVIAYLRTIPPLPDK